MKERNLKTTVRDFFNNNKLLSSSWGINYIWIILISIILGIIIVFISGHHLRRELNSGNQAFVNAYGQNIDNVLTSAKQTEYQIMSDRKILNFISTPFDDKRNMILSASDISSKLAVLVHNNYWLENIYLYSKKNDRLIDVHGSYTADNFYRSHLSESMDKSVFFSILHERADNRYVDFYADNQQYIAYISHKKDISNSYTAILLLNPEKVFENFIKSNFSQYGAFALFYKDGNAFMYYDGQTCSKPLNLNYNVLSENNTSAHAFNLDKKNYLITSAASSVDDFVYIFFDDYSRTNAIIWVQIVLIIALLLLSITISGYYIYKNTSTSFKKIYNILLKLHYGIIPNENIIDTLEKQVSILYKEKISMETGMYKQRKAIVSIKLEKLLKNSSVEDAEILDELSDFGVEFPNDYFLVIGFYVLDYLHIFRDIPDTNEDLSNDSDLCMFILENIFEELISAKCPVYFTVSDGLLTAICNVRGMGNDVTNDLIDTLNDGIKLISEQFCFRYVISLSNIDFGANGISSLYENMILNFENIVSDEKKIIYTYSAENSSKPGISAGFSELEERLHSAIVTKSFDSAINTLDKISEFFNDNMNTMDISVNIFKLSSIIVSALSSIMDDNRFNEIVNDIRIAEKIIIPYKYFNKIKSLFVELKEIYCSDISSQSDSDNDLINRVHEYIHQNLSCKSLGIPMICDYVNLSSRSLSREYKQHTGSTVSKYIQSARMAESKRLLAETDKSINEIAEAVGYDYAISFIRTFKKFEGITPSEFRSNNKI